MDTVAFDTVITLQGTATKQMVVYNHSKKQINISSIKVAGLASKGHFHLNVDGVRGDEFQNVEIRGNDSIFIFIEAYLDEMDNDAPTLIEDRLVFVTNGMEQKVLLSAWGQDYLIPQEEIEKVIGNIGIEQRRIAAADVTASDLCFKAAQQLMNDNNIEPDSIDVLLFMSQTADYRIPATSCLLQHRLGLRRDIVCFDISLGCSGFLFALSTAFAYASLPGINRVLLLDGETFSKIVNRRDKVDWTVQRIPCQCLQP